MKYLEQRVEELEKELALVRAKIKLEETKTTGFVNKQPIRVQKKDTSHYLKNNYPPSPDWRNKEINDYTFNSSVNLMSEPDLETAFASPWDSSEMKKNPLDTITLCLSSTISDTLYNHNYIDSSDLPQYIPPYPDIIGSWDDKAYEGGLLSTFDTEDKNYSEYVDSAIFNFDKEDKRFLEYLNSAKTKNTMEKKIENDFGKIISKFKILNHEWEMDGYGYIVNDGTQNKVVITNHNKPIVANVEYIHAKIREYKETIQETERALFLIK
jgi:hypothetical protein